MNDDETIAKIQKAQQVLLEQFVNLAGLVTELRASVNVLKLYVAMQLSPGDPALALAELGRLEQALLKSSPDEQERLRTADLIHALKEWKKGGGRPPGSA